MSIALSGTSPASKVLAESSVALGLSNIRLIKKIERAVQIAESMLRGFDQIVVTQAVKTLTLVGWSIYEPNGAPSISYLDDRAAHMFTAGKEAIPEKEAAWNAILDAFGFLGFEEFDQVLLEGMQTGYFDPSRLREHAAVIDRNAKNSQSREALEKAWRTFHDSFADNEGEVIKTVYEASISNLPAMSVLDLNATTLLFKALGQANRAQDLVDRFIALRHDDPKVFDLDSFPFRSNVNDPDLIKQFREHYAALQTKLERSPDAILLDIAKVRGWNPDDLSTLAKLGADDYYALFKSHSGEALHQMIKVCLEFNMGGASAEMTEISRKAKEALEGIGNESRINALRVRRYGAHGGFRPALEADTPRAPNPEEQ